MTARTEKSAYSPNNLFTILNTALSLGLLSIANTIEHRFTVLETNMALVMQTMHVTPYKPPPTYHAPAPHQPDSKPAAGSGR